MNVLLRRTLYYGVLISLSGGIAVAIWLAFWFLLHSLPHAKLAAALVAGAYFLFEFCFVVLNPKYRGPGY